MKEEMKNSRNRFELEGNVARINEIYVNKNGKKTLRFDLGNLNYGFVGTFMGFEEEILYAGGGYANQGISTELFSAPYFGDNPNDHIAINIGIYYYNNGMKINYDDFYDYIFNN